MQFPDDYVPMNGCRSCGLDFTSLDAFDRHLQGTPEHREPCLGVDLTHIGLELRDTIDGVEPVGHDYDRGEACPVRGPESRVSGRTLDSPASEPLKGSEA